MNIDIGYDFVISSIVHNSWKEEEKIEMAFLFKCRQVLQPCGRGNKPAFGGIKGFTGVSRQILLYWINQFSCLVCLFL